MKGRRTFSTTEIAAIEHTLRQLRRSADRGRQKALRQQLREDYRFYISDFRRGARAFTADDVERLIGQGVIRVRA